MRSVFIRAIRRVFGGQQAAARGRWVNACPSPPDVCFDCDCQPLNEHFRGNEAETGNDSRGQSPPRSTSTRPRHLPRFQLGRIQRSGSISAGLRHTQRPNLIPFHGGGSMANIAGRFNQNQATVLPALHPPRPATLAEVGRPVSKTKKPLYFSLKSPVETSHACATICVSASCFRF
jgi:hypothetical protein